jgi:hypothetical protein
MKRFEYTQLRSGHGNFEACVNPLTRSFSSDQNPRRENRFGQIRVELVDEYLHASESAPCLPRENCAAMQTESERDELRVTQIHDEAIGTAF